MTITLKKHTIFDLLYPPHLSIEEKLELERTQWHLFPYRRLHYKVDANNNKYEITPEVCDDEHSINDFPGPVLTSKQN